MHITSRINWQNKASSKDTRLQKTPAKRSPSVILLIAIADCERKIGAVSPDQQASIAAGTYYEQAMTLFSRTGNVSGEAYANYKLGAMKEEEGNTDGALTFYRRAFELCSNQAGEFNNWGEDEEFFGIREGAIAEGIPFAQETFWYEPLVVALARQGRAEEALDIYEQGKAKFLSAELRSFPYEFRDKNAGQAVESMQRQMQSAGVKEAELAFQKGLNANQRDAERIASARGRSDIGEQCIVQRCLSTFAKIPAARNPCPHADISGSGAALGVVVRNGRAGLPYCRRPHCDFRDLIRRDGAPNAGERCGSAGIQRYRA